jgi:hypothetical protein
VIAFVPQFLIDCAEVIDGSALEASAGTTVNTIELRSGRLHAERHHLRAGFLN